MSTQPIHVPPAETRELQPAEVDVLREVLEPVRRAGEKPCLSAARGVLTGILISSIVWALLIIGLVWWF